MPYRQQRRSNEIAATGKHSSDTDSFSGMVTLLFNVRLLPIVRPAQNSSLCPTPTVLPRTRKRRPKLLAPARNRLNHSVTSYRGKLHGPGEKKKCTSAKPLQDPFATLFKATYNLDGFVGVLCQLSYNITVLYCMF